MKYEQYSPHKDFGLVADVWLSLLSKCQHSYFTSWGWISVWIKSLPVENEIKLIVGYLDGEPVVAFFIGKKKRRKYGFLPSNVMSLNSASDAYYDQLFVEYNSMLVAPTVSLSREKLFDYLDTLEWDEFVLPGASLKFVSEHNFLDNTSRRGFYILVDKISNSSFVELEKIRNAEMDYLKLLSSNKRSQIRRSIKQYEIDGSVEIKEAEDVNEALFMFDHLVSLHQQEWAKRGRPGAFSNKYLLQFHKDLIRSRFDQKEIQLLHIYNKKMTIGYLYNFIYRQDVLFYQSGFNYLNENTYRPGLVSHYLAIMHNVMKNMSTYDFLAGDSAYKHSLSTNHIPMYWVRFLKGRQRYCIEKSIVDMKDKLSTMPKIEARLKNINYWMTSIRK